MQTLIQHLTTPDRSQLISAKAYQKWRKLFVWQALKGSRFGEAFCKHFGIRDYRIQFAATVDSAETIIYREWVKPMLTKS